MKWNWGTGIFIAILLFMAFIITLVVFTTRQDYDLVEKDYYPKALAYQQQIDKRQNLIDLNARVVAVLSDDKILIQFPEQFSGKKIEGTIHFYKPDSKANDLILEIEADTTGKAVVERNRLAPGKYLIKVDFTVNGTGYYQEVTLIN
ncbi:MAG: FixH family protein [Bacteroidales bacterium]